MNKKVKAKIIEGDDVVEVVGVLYATTDDGIVIELGDGTKKDIAKDDMIDPLEYLTDSVLVVPGKEVVVVEEKKGVAKLKEGGKLDLVVKLMLKNPGQTRKWYISQIVETGIMTSLAGASTYHQNAKAHLGLK